MEIKEQEILPIVKRELNEEKVFKVLPEGFAREGFALHRIRLGQSVKVIILVFALLLFYMLFQYRYVIINPPLEIMQPKEGAIISSQTVNVFGKTDPNATVFVNNEPAALNNNGNFKKTITVFTGRTTIAVKAVNSFGKESKKEISIQVTGVDR